MPACAPHGVHSARIRACTAGVTRPLQGERAMDLQGKVAIVTGGGTGIGKAIAKLLAAAGAHVVVNYSRSEAEAMATAKELETNHVQALPMKADVSSAAQVAALVEQTERALGRIDIL